MQALPPRVAGGAVLLPRATFSTDWLEPEHRTDAWREVVNSLYDVTPIEDGHRGVLGGTIETFGVGSLSIGLHTFEGQRSRRDVRRIEAMSSDAVLLQLFTAGSMVGTFGDRSSHTHAGDISLCDYRQPMSAIASAGSTISVVIPRLMLAEHPDSRDVHGLVLDGRRPVVRLLAGHLRDLAAMLPEMSLADGPEIADLTVSMVACVISGATPLDPARGPGHTHSLRGDILRHIEEHVCSPDLTPAQLESQFGLSRTTLYRIFADEGGVSRVIQRLRLDRARTMLRQNRHTVLETAMALGFSSEQHLARAFKSRYGLTPGAARGAAGADGDPAELHRLFESRLSRYTASIQRP